MLKMTNRKRTKTILKANGTNNNKIIGFFYIHIRKDQILSDILYIK